jgi:hypothetical protein
MLSADSPVLDSQNRSPALEDDHDAPNEREVFKWTRLRNIEDIIFSREGLKKRPAPLVDANVGTPTVLAADKFICVGTDAGRILVFDFKQTLRCICGTETLGMSPRRLSICDLQLFPRKDRGRRNRDRSLS